MALHHLLVRGIRSALADGEDQLAAHLASLGHPAETVEHVRQTIEAMPGLLVALDRALWSRDAPLFARALYMVVLSYLIHDENLIPTDERHPVLGLLDDTYLLHRAAQELRDYMTSVYMRSVDGGVDLLTRVLPTDVTARLDAKILAAVGTAEQMSR
ncbi:MAG TPA: hypothetical protein VIL20_04460 [Sandaracinaceae bacterium]